MSMPLFFATAPKGMEDLLAAELQALGAEHVRATRAGVEFGHSLEAAYRACLSSRIANRVLLPLVSQPIDTPEALYEVAYAIPWHEHMDVRTTFVVDAAGMHDQLTHSHYVALRVKDAIADYFRDRDGERPFVDPEQPDLRINVHLSRDQVGIGIDLSGGSLHRRGYRPEGAAAPLKENLAAAILMRSGWPQATPLIDPMCGSGTLLIEAAGMAADIAPGLWRQARGQAAPMAHWHQHDAALWERLYEQASVAAKAGMAKLPPLHGFDTSRHSVEVSEANIARAGLSDYISVTWCDIGKCAPPEGTPPGHLVVNPPYGERLGDKSEMFGLYARLGQVLKDKFGGWQAHLFTQDAELGKATGLRATKRHVLYNGALACNLLHIPLFAADPEQPARHDGGRLALLNRLAKNLSKLRPWARKNNITCYRVYDADLPEYAVAIDLYDRHVQVQEYQAPKTIDPGRAKARLRDVMLVIPDALDVDPRDVFLKVRKRQRGAEQYDKQGEDGRFYRVEEGPCTFYVNFTDYLDTGLFLDHRPLRTKLAAGCTGLHFLNLFAYTGTASVAAAHGGARSTTSVDMSRTYLGWAERNLRANGFDLGQHELVQADVLGWLEDAPSDSYDVILLDPPTFSNSKRMTDTFDVQRDHLPLLRATDRLLAPGGTLYFSNNAKRFKLDPQVAEFCDVREITDKTVPQDFKRSKPHQSWRITKPAK